MTDEELIARLRERAAEERIIQKNNEAVAAALRGQRLLFDQGVRSASNNFAVRLGLEHENCAKNDAKLARDWDAAADRIEALVAENAEYEEVFDMQWKAGMRAVERWREAHPGNDLVLPDTADLCLWLLARVERLEAALREIESIDVHSGGEIHGVTALQWELAFAHAQDVASVALKGDKPCLTTI